MDGHYQIISVPLWNYNDEDAPTDNTDVSGLYRGGNNIYS